MSADFPGVQLHVVTGKGGTGKTTVAAALALALAAGGRTVLLCEVEGRQGIAQLFDVPPLPYEERLLASGAAGPTGSGDVYALAIDPESALLEYLDMYYRLGRAGKALDRFGVIEFATTIAPGVRDVLLTGKVYEAANRNRRNKGARHYDAIVLDAPPTGRIAQFLNVNDELAGLAKVGPVKGQADVVMSLLRSPRTAIHLVSVLEEMPVQETADGIDQLREHRPAGGGCRGQPGPSAGPRRPRTPPAARRDRRPRRHPHEPGEDRPRGRRGHARRAARGGSPPRGATCPRGQPARPRRVARRADLRAAEASRAASTWAGSTSSPACSPPRGWDDPPAPQLAGPGARRPADRHPRAAGGARRRRPHRRPQPAHHRVLRLRGASARPPPPRRWPCALPSAAARSSC